MHEASYTASSNSAVEPRCIRHERSRRGKADNAPSEVDPSTLRVATSALFIYHQSLDQPNTSSVTTVSQCCKHISLLLLCRPACYLSFSIYLVTFLLSNMSQTPIALPPQFQPDRAKMTTQNQPGPKPFIFGAERSTSTSSSPERPQTFFDCLEEQDPRHDTSSENLTSPMPAHVTVETPKGEAEERPPGSEAARTFNNSSATTVNKFARIGNGLEPFNILGLSSGSTNAPPPLSGNPHPSDSEAAKRPSEGNAKPEGLFGLFEVRRPSTPTISKPPSSDSAAPSLLGHAPPAQTPRGLFSASTTLNKGGHEGAGFGQSNTRGPPAQSKNDPPSIFDLPPPQSENPSSSLFGNFRPSDYGQTPSAPSEGTSFFGGSPSARASGGLFGASTPGPTSGGLFEAPTQTSGGLFGASTFAGASDRLFEAPTPAQASGSLFGASTPAQTSGGLFSALRPAQASGGLLGTSAPAQTSGGLFGASTQESGGLFRASTTAEPSGGLFGACQPARASGSLFGVCQPARATGGIFGSLKPAQTSGGLLGTSTPAQTSGGLFGTSAPARASGANQAGALHNLLGQDLQSKTDDAWTQQQLKIQLALSSIQDAQAHGQEAHNSFRRERDQLQDQIKHLKKQLEGKQAQMVAMSEQIEKANEQANEQILKMRRYFSGSGRPPSGTFNQDEWFFDCAANRKFGAVYGCLRRMFSGELHPTDFLKTIKLEDVWYDPFNLCLRREVFLKDGHIYLRKSGGASAAPDAGMIVAGTQVEKNQTQITDTFKPNIEPEASSSDNKDKLDTSNVAPEPAASGNSSKAKSAKDTMGKTIKGRHGRIMSLGPSASQSEEIPSLAKLSEASRTESTKALAGLTPTDENNSNVKPTHIRSRSDSTHVPIRGKRSSSARPISKDENDSAKQTSAPAIRPLIKEEWLTNEQRVSRIRKEEDETVERAMLRKRQQKGQ